jgi:hypothetical protein
MSDDKTITSKYKTSDTPSTPNNGDSVDHQEPDSLAVNDDETTTPIDPIDLETVMQIHQKVKVAGRRTFPWDMPDKPSESESVFTLDGGEKAVYTESVQNGVTYSLKKITRLDGSVKGHERWLGPASEGSERITEDYEYDFAPNGDGVGRTDDGFEILRKIDGTVHKVPMKWGGPESPQSCSYRWNYPPTSASKRGNGTIQQSPWPSVVKPKGPKDGPFFTNYSVSSGQPEPGAVAAAYSFFI